MTTSPPPPPTAAPLTEAQESRLILYLDDQLLALTRNFEARRAPQATLSTLSSYLAALAPLHSLVLTIPPSQPSGALRVSYYLNLTSRLPEAIENYDLDANSLPELWTTLRRWDRAWVTVLRGEEWDSARGVSRAGVEGVERKVSPSTGSGGSVTFTDRARLTSLTEEIRTALAVALGLPSKARMQYNPLGEVMEPSMKVEGEATMSEEDKPALLDMEEGAREDSASITDATTPSEGVEMDEDDDEEEEDDDFEEVDVVSSTSDDEDQEQPQDAAFSISFAAPPPVAPTEDVDMKPAVTQQLGFDPDEEYGDDETEEDRGALVEWRDVLAGVIAELLRA